MPDSHDASPRFRAALAAAVACACAAAAAALALLLADAGAEPARAKAERPAAPTGHAHGAHLGAPDVAERQLRAIETATLGPEHAREHALIRQADPQDPARLDETAAPRVNGSVAAEAAAAVGEPQDVGRWDPAKTELPIVAIHAALLPTGKVMFFTYPAGKNSAEAWLWNPATGVKEKKNPPNLENGEPANIWCAGQTFTADGELVVFGGNLDFPPPGSPPTGSWKGLNKVYTFNPFTETWREQPDMRHGRWYPTGIRMADGRIPIISGLDESGAINPSSTNPEVEVFTPPANIGEQGTISYVGNLGNVPDQPPIGGLYPRMIAMSSGRALIAGPAISDSWFFTGVDNPYTWSDIPNLSREHTWGTTVPLPAGAGGPTRVMALGGTTSDLNPIPSSPDAEVFDEANPGAGWQPAKPNRIGRGHANTVLLPDGSMVEVGGGIGSDAVMTPYSPLHAATAEQRQIELWDPVTGEWRLGPPQTESRAYHSTALLLPDGRVMSAGDEYNPAPATPGSVDTAEIYEPPYLFRGPRPTISSAPSDITFGGAFGVQTPDTNITSAALVAPAAVTHGVDMNQRMLKLDVTRSTGCVDVTAPTNANAAPPGWYMLFLLNAQGVPSVAKFVKLHAGAAPSACAAQPQPQPQPQAQPQPDPAPPAPAKNLSPAISGLKLSRATFRKGADTKISFRLSEAAKLSVTFERKLTGRRVRGRCVKPTEGRRPNCTRYARAKTVNFQAKAGANTLLLRARLFRTLATGRYRLTLLATDSTGKRSVAARTNLRLLESAAQARSKSALAAALSLL